MMVVMGDFRGKIAEPFSSRDLRMAKRSSKARRSLPVADKLARYRAMRDFGATPEPAGGDAKRVGPELAYAVQKHRARQLHYDLRLEIDGVLKSWAVAKGPSLDPKIKRLAVQTEDHPMEYGNFEGIIPAGQYGGGAVMVWDRGTWVAMGDAAADYRNGQIKFRLAGEKLKGGWTLVQTKRGGGSQWLLIKERDIFAAPEEDGPITETAPDSALSGRSIEAIAEAGAAARTAVSRKRTRIPPGRLVGAQKAGLADVVAAGGATPQLATPARQAPDGTGWLHEIKYDGYRTLAVIAGDGVTLLTRNGHDWTDRYGAIATALTDVPCRQAILDGEICVQDADGRTDFSRLKDALSAKDDEALVYLVFDLLYLDGYDLRATPLIDRKLGLEAVLDPIAESGGPIQYSAHMAGQGGQVFGHAAAMGLEGVISKRADAPYTAGRGRDWLKVKAQKSDGFHIVGYTDSKAAGGLGALLVAQADATAAKGLRFAGRVGTGFDGDSVGSLLRRLKRLARKTPAIAIPAAAIDDQVRFVRPDLVADVSYGSLTKDGNVRHGVYRGLREDADSAVQDGPGDGRAVEPRRPAKQISDQDLAGVWVTNPDRVMFGRGGPRKLDLVMYYARVADWMLPELARRPITLVRCPTGKTADLFYQRHGSSGMPAEAKGVSLREDGGKERADYLYIDDAKGLLALAQFGVIEFHPWGCRVDKPERPDRIVFDLDPDEGLAWREVVDAARHVRSELAALGFTGFVRTTGGKGLHVVIAITRRYSWTTVKDFARGFVSRLAAREPRRYTAVSSLKQRRGRLFIDYLRNGRGATAVGSYSLRARLGDSGVPVATPLSWSELDDLDDPLALDHESVARRLEQLVDDPWHDLESSARGLRRDVLEKLTKST